MNHQKWKQENEVQETFKEWFLELRGLAEQYCTEQESTLKGLSISHHLKG